MKITDDKLPILQDLETAVVDVWRVNPTMSDHVALRAYETAFQLYRAELRGRTPKPHVLSGLDAATFEAVRLVCEIRLGRGPEPADGSKPTASTPVDILVDCLRELGKSVERHTHLEGRQGYLTFIDHFLE